MLHNAIIALFFSIGVVVAADDDYINPANFPNALSCDTTGVKQEFEKQYRGENPIPVGLTPPDRNNPGKRLSPVIDGLLEDSVWFYAEPYGTSTNATNVCFLDMAGWICDSARSRFNGPQDLHAIWRYMYDNDALYIGIQIHDDVIDVDTTFFVPAASDGFTLAIDPSDWGDYDNGFWQKSTNLFRNYFNRNPYDIASGETPVPYPEGAFLTLNARLKTNSDISAHIRGTLKHTGYYPFDTNGTKENPLDGLYGIQLATACQGQDRFGRVIYHVEIKLPFHGELWPELETAGFFDENGFPLEGKRFKMDFENYDRDNNGLGDSTNGVTLRTMKNQIFHEEPGYFHFNNTKYFPTFIYSRAVISGAKPIFGFNQTSIKDVPTSTQDSLLIINPNPFNPSTVIRLDNNHVPATIRIYNVQGALVKGFNNVKSAAVIWDAHNMSSGIYLVKVIMDEKTITRKVVLQR